jgi:hypothetical protein
MKIIVTHELELTATIHKLKMWRHYLMGRTLELRADDNALKYLFEHETLNVRKTGWLAFLGEYEI